MCAAGNQCLPVMRPGDRDDAESPQSNRPVLVELVKRQPHG